MYHEAVIRVYGREQICASCVGAPGSKETYEWLQAALNRKYYPGKFHYEYIDMDEPQENETNRRLIKQMEEGDWLFPLVMLNEDIIAEGIPHAKKIYQAIEAMEKKEKK